MTTDQVVKIPWLAIWGGWSRRPACWHFLALEHSLPTVGWSLPHWIFGEYKNVNLRKQQVLYFILKHEQLLILYIYRLKTVMYHYHKSLAIFCSFNNEHLPLMVFHIQTSTSYKYIFLKYCRFKFTNFTFHKLYIRFTIIQTSINNINYLISGY